MTLQSFYDFVQRDKGLTLQSPDQESFVMLWVFDPL